MARQAKPLPPVARWTSAVVDAYTLKPSLGGDHPFRRRLRRLLVVATWPAAAQLPEMAVHAALAPGSNPARAW